MSNQQNNSNSNSSQRTSYGQSRGGQSSGSGSSQNRGGSVAKPQSSARAGAAGGSKSADKEMTPTTHYAYTLNDAKEKEFVTGLFIREIGEFGTLSVGITDKFVNPGKTMYISKSKPK